MSDAQPERRPLDAIEVAAAVRSGEMSAVESAEAAIRALEEVEPQVNGLVTECFDRALTEAAAAERSAPLAGVPIVVKDYLATCAGVRHTESSRLLSDFIADEDSEYVRRLRASGAIILGTSNLPEFALIGTTEPVLNGATRNPWNLDRTVGGSSGGSAALVASLAVPAAHGNDAGGSIRCPASCCGLFGLKPTRGRNSLAPAHGDLGTGIWAEHVLTRSVRDSAAFLDATAGPVIGDPHTCPPPDRPFLTEVTSSPGRLRIAVTVNPSPSIDLHPACAEAVRDAAALCAELGHEIVEFQPRLDEVAFGDAFGTLYFAGTAQRVEQWADVVGKRPEEESLEPLTVAVLEAGRQVTAVEFLSALHRMQWHARELAAQLEPFDAWLTPTLSLPPVPIGWMDGPPDAPLRASEKDFQFCPYTWFANATGQPAMSLPLSWDGDGLPIGTQFVGRFGREDVLFSLAGQLEAARPWSGRIPPVHAASALNR